MALVATGISLTLHQIKTSLYHLHNYVANLSNDDDEQLNNRNPNFSITAWCIGGNVLTPLLR